MQYIIHSYHFLQLVLVILCLEMIRQQSMLIMFVMTRLVLKNLLIQFHQKM